MDNHKHLRRLTLDAMFLGAALMLAFAEALLPPLPFHGVKLGLANLATLCCAYAVGLADAALVALARWVLSGLLFGALAGAISSLARRTGSVSISMLFKRLPGGGTGGFTWMLYCMLMFAACCMLLGGSKPYRRADAAC